MTPSALHTKTKSFQQKINTLPTTPGVYLYKDENDEVIYVGKAKVLKNRVSSYFSNFLKLESKTQQMIVQATDIEIIEVDTEFEALILETNLIKKYRPKYNILMKDDKNYLYVRFEKKRRSNQPKPTKKSVYQDFPRITIVRDKKNDGAEYFGPYPSKVPLKRVIKRLRKVFPFRSSNYLIIQESENPLKVNTNAERPCFYYHLGLCMGACAGLESKKEYNKRFDDIRKFFKGEKKAIMNKLERKMSELSKEMKYEEAAKVRDRIEDIKFVTAHITIENDVDDILVKEVKERSREMAIDELTEFLHFPKDVLKKKKNFRIEAYDISNIQGTNATGSMVVQVDGEAKPSLYRRFKIKSMNTPNDFEMMKEVLARRFNQLLQNNIQNLTEKKQFEKSLAKRMKMWKVDESFVKKPDLIIIDGGKGQLTAAYEVLKLFELEKDIPIVGLAKREEEIFKMKEQFGTRSEVENAFERVKLPRKSESLYLVQRIRDEAHRFAKAYHTKLRNKALLEKVK